MSTTRIHPTLEHLSVPIDSLSPYPGNARRGNLDVLCDSLAKHGQYRPIIVRKDSHQILAGYHTWRAAERLGWESIAAQSVDVDDEQAARIVLVDNKASDNGTYDDPVLLDFLAGLPDLDGTGWDDEDLRRLRLELEDHDLAEVLDQDRDKPDAKNTDTSTTPNKITVGEFVLNLSDKIVKPWQESVVDANDLELGRVIADVRDRLGLPEAPPNEKAISATKVWSAAEEKERKRQRTIRLSALRRAGGEVPVVLEAEKVAINDIAAHPHNPRRGDVNVLAESLLANGQYRPVVANKRTGLIVGGNHTWKVAKALGWKEIAVTWIDVDVEEEARILLIDNRSSDLSGYDAEALLSLVSATGGATGTGYDEFDLDEMIYEADRKAEADLLRANPPRGPVAVKVLGWHFQVRGEDYDTWAEGMRAQYGAEDGQVCAGIAARLGIDLS